GLRWLDELRVLANEHCFVFFQAVGTAQRGWCLAALGDAQQGAGLLRAAIAPLQKAGSLIWIPSFLRAEAEALVHAERWEEARGRLDESIALATATGAAWDLAEMHRVRGDLLAARGDASGAEDAYADAIASAGALGAHLFALRAATSLAGLRGERGRPAEGIAALAPLLDRFGEETGAPDLERARTVLNALRASAVTH
ncbi:MAG TPA: hypothetical protein VFN46_06125, partial [Acetobacteraceae bacterium]|nr:hypothetical protein [Acetobacteraceae bacterium]